MKKVTRADAILRITMAPLPSAKDRTNHPMRLCRSCLASSSARVELPGVSRLIQIGNKSTRKERISPLSVEFDDDD